MLGDLVIVRLALMLQHHQRLSLQVDTLPRCLVFSMHCPKTVTSQGRTWSHTLTTRLSHAPKVARSVPSIARQLAEMHPFFRLAIRWLTVLRLAMNLTPI